MSRRKISIGLTTLCFCAIAILSLIPGQLRPHTKVADIGENFLFYFGCAAILSAISVRNSNWIWIALGLSFYSALMEILQYWAPGRVPDFTDFAANSAGAGSGAAVIFLARNFWARRQKS